MRSQAILWLLRRCFRRIFASRSIPTLHHRAGANSAARTRTTSSGDVEPQLAGRLSTFVTSAAAKHATAERSMVHTGHKSVGMVRVYTRRVDAFTDHAGEGLL